ITHLKKFKETEMRVRAFYQLAEVLDTKLGCILFQMPANVHYHNEILERILNQLDSTKRNVLEFRHPSWWCDEVKNALQKHNIMFCALDAPELPNDIVRAGNDLYVRFHGKKMWYADNYTRQDLKKWLARISSHPFKNVWIYFNNDANAYAP